jgi:hypothetical protein
MELHEFDRVGLGQMPCDVLGDIGLPGARRTVEDDLPARPEQVDDLLQPWFVDEQLVGERVVRVAQHQVGDRLYLLGWTLPLTEEAFEDRQLLGQVHDIGLAGQLGRQRRGQIRELQGRIGVAPLNVSAQVRALIWRVDPLGVAGGDPEVDLAAAGRHDEVAGLQAGQERVELDDLLLAGSV